MPPTAPCASETGEHPISPPEELANLSLRLPACSSVSLAGVTTDEHGEEKLLQEKGFYLVLDLCSRLVDVFAAVRRSLVDADEKDVV